MSAKIGLIILLLSSTVATGVLSFKKSQQKSGDLALSAQICDFVQHQAQVGATRQAFDQAYSLLSLQAKSTKSFVILKDGLSEYGQPKFYLKNESHFKFECSFLGYADSQITFYFLENSIFNTDLLALSLVIFALLSGLYLVVSFILKRFYQNITDAISQEVTSALGLESIQTKKSKIYQLLASLLSTKIKHITPQIQKLKSSITEATEKSISEAEKRIHFEKQAEKGKDLLNVIQQVKHDIRSPLSSLKMILSNVDDLSMRENIENSVHRIDGILSDLTNLEEVTNESSGLGAEKIDLAEVMIFEIIAEKKRLVKSSLKLNFDYNANQLSSVRVSGSHFKRVISNIVQNSIEAFNTGADAEKRIDVSVKSRFQQVYIEIKDNGCGIPEDILNKLLSEQITFGKKLGSGLGLSHAKTYIKRWGGQISITSTKNSGTTVLITLPLAMTGVRYISPVALSKSQELIMIDDDGTHIQQALNGNGFVTKLFKPKAFLNWFVENADVKNHALCLDFNLRESFTGADLARNVPHEFTKYILTDDYMNLEAIAVSKELDIPIMPKNLL
jgi:signal transduction histidine kinase